MIRFFLIVLLLFVSNVWAISFDEAMTALKKHESIESILFKSHSAQNQAILEASWGDPKLKVAFKNFPKDTLSRTQSPMTGVEYGLSQKIPLTPKYGTVKQAFSALSQAYNYEAKDKKEMLAKAFWKILILKKEIVRQRTILKESIAWIEKILKVTKGLYATGKVSQQALLDIQIRKSELERDISNKDFEQSQIDEKLIYLIGSSEIENSTIPWDILDRSVTKAVDYRALSLQERLKFKNYNVKASKLDYVPDLTLFVGYTDRSDVDSYGDFVSASITLNLPFSDQKSSKYGMALQEKFQVEKDYENYKRAKHRDILLLTHEIKKLSKEIEILDTKMIKFAVNSREITSKSYSTGGSTYIELLQSELKLQKILMQKIALESNRDIQKVALKYIKGEALYE